MLVKPIISVSLVDDENNEEGGGEGMKRPRANSCSPIVSEEIVCSTGELMNLKCLSSSAVEMRSLQGNNELLGESDYNGRRGSLFTGNNNYANQQQHQRSRSFDASYLGVNKKLPAVKSNLFSGLLNRIRQVGSPSNNSNSSNGNGASQNAPPSTPISTVLIVDPSGCGPNTVITACSPTNEEPPQCNISNKTNEPNETGIPWDNKTGYFLDASVLGLAIENHLKGDPKGKQRRATFSTLSETNSQFLGQSYTSVGNHSNRPRSASAYSVILLAHGKSGPLDPETISRRRESIASVFPHVSKNSSGGRRNSSFTSSSGGDFFSQVGPPSPQSEEIVGSFIKTSMTSELYSEGETIIEEDQLDIDNYDNQGQKNSGGKLLGGIDFWTKKPSETIINFISGGGGGGGSSSTRLNNNNPDFGPHRPSVATINEEGEDGSPQRQPPLITICGLVRNFIMQFINSFFRS